MNAPIRRQAEAAFTLVEVLVVVAVLALLAGIILPMLSAAQAIARRNGCDNNLKNIGLAYRIFQTDNNDQMPWELGGTNGTEAYLEDPQQLWRHFAFVSQQLGTPKNLYCPSDSGKKMASDFATLDNKNLSYFLGLLASGKDPNSLLSGDRNLMTNGVPVSSGLLQLSTNLTWGFTKKMHEDAGNIVRVDGSVQEVTSALFQRAVLDAGLPIKDGPNRLLIP